MSRGKEVNDTSSTFISVFVKPRAKRDEIVTWQGGMIGLHVKAPPVGGAANEGCRRLLARVLGVPPSTVVIRKGDSSRIKKIQILGVSKYDIERIRQKWYSECVNRTGDQSGGVQGGD